MEVSELNWALKNPKNDYDDNELIYRQNLFPKDQPLARKINLLLNVEYTPDRANYIFRITVAYQITSLTIVYSTVYSGADQRKHQSSMPLAFVRGIHRWPVNSPHKWPVTRKMFQWRRHG